ncbi:MAG: hypothetical protein H6R01_2078 [Burkholderiaceae bacterium]|nr:hypothetical protein [Burkholderiaceae bacterium]
MKLADEIDQTRQVRGLLNSEQARLLPLRKQKRVLLYLTKMFNK